MSDNSGGCRVIGMCGRSGSGKTTVCRAFEKLGIRAVDTDQVYRELTKPDGEGKPSALVQRIAVEFGNGVVSADGSLNRAALARAVFGEGKKENLQRLNSITHGPILERTVQIIGEYEKDGAKGVIVDAPALFESGFDKKCDAVICVSAPDDVLLRRIMERDLLSEEAAKKRLSSQMDDGVLRARADHVIENDGEHDIEKAAKAALEKIFD